MKSFPYHLAWVGVVLAALATTGCEESADTGGSDMDALAAQLEQSKKAAAEAAAAEQVRAEAAAKVAADAAAAAQAKLAAEQATTAPEDEVTFSFTVKNPQALLKGIDPRDKGGKTTAGAATVGEGGGYLSAIAAAHRHITTRMDDLAWQQAIQHYKATTGKMPKNHEEFMKGVIEGFGIELPPLEQGEEYLWVPDEGQFGTLYLVQPAPPEQTPPASE